MRLPHAARAAGGGAHPSRGRRGRCDARFRGAAPRPRACVPLGRVHDRIRQPRDAHRHRRRPGSKRRGGECSSPTRHAAAGSGHGALECGARCPLRWAPEACAHSAAALCRDWRRRCSGCIRLPRARHIYPANARGGRAARRGHSGHDVLRPEAHGVRAWRVAPGGGAPSPRPSASVATDLPVEPSNAKVVLEVDGDAVIRRFLDVVVGRER